MDTVAKKEKSPLRKLVPFGVSLLLFLQVGGTGKIDLGLCLLALVIGIHELGHFLAMKALWRASLWPSSRERFF